MRRTPGDGAKHPENGHFPPKVYTKVYTDWPRSSAPLPPAPRVATSAKTQPTPWGPSRLFVPYAWRGGCGALRRRWAARSPILAGRGEATSSAAPRLFEQAVNRDAPGGLLRVCQGFVHAAVQRAQVLSVCLVSQRAFADAENRIDRVDHLQDGQLGQRLPDPESSMEATLRSNDSLFA